MINTGRGCVFSLCMPSTKMLFYPTKNSCWSFVKTKINANAFSEEIERYQRLKTEFWQIAFVPKEVFLHQSAENFIDGACTEQTLP